MSSEDICSPNDVSSHFEEFSDHLEEVLELILTYGEFHELRPFLWNFTHHINEIYNILTKILECSTLTQETAAILSTLQHPLNDADEILFEVYELQDIPPTALYSVRAICLVVVLILSITFQDVIQLMGFAIGTDSRLGELLTSPYISEMYITLFEANNSSLEPQTCYARLSLLMEELREILDSMPEDYEADDPGTSTSSENRGTSQEVIEANSLAYKYKKIPKSFGSSEVMEECIVCMSSLEDDDGVRRLKCLHLFHISCADKWLHVNSKCPVCRLDIGEESSDFPTDSKGEG